MNIDCIACIYKHLRHLLQCHNHVFIQHHSSGQVHLSDPLVSTCPPFRCIGNCTFGNCNDWTHRNPATIPRQLCLQEKYMYIWRRRLKGVLGSSSIFAMRFILAAFFGVCVTALATSFPPSPELIGSDVQILLHNDLYGNASDRQNAIIVAGTAGTYSQAKKACAAVSESLWTPPADIGTADFLDYLSYQTKRGKVPKQSSERLTRPREQHYYVSGSGSHEACNSINLSSGKLQSVACNTRLPALCTQSAPLSFVKNTDTSLYRQTQVLNGKAVYTGWRDKLSFRFLGIRYATFPQRFTDSSPTIPTGNIDALDFGARCASRGSRTGPVQGAEDCLFLNIYTPFLPKSHGSEAKLRPVMFWIHGGAFVNGAGSDPTFDGGNLASRGDVVVVTINYRQELSID
jgi:hypothetical protein